MSLALEQFSAMRKQIAECLLTFDNLGPMETNNRMFLTYSTISIHCAERVAFLPDYSIVRKKGQWKQGFISDFHCLYLSTPLR